MKIPTQDALTRNLREMLVLKAEELYLMAGGETGDRLVELVTKVKGVNALPTDWFANESVLREIPSSGLAIQACAGNLLARLETRSMGARLQDGTLDSDVIEQQCLDHIELFLSSLPDVALAGLDWTESRNGALRDLLLLGKAWHHLIVVIDNGTHGDFNDQCLSAVDLALIAGIEVRTLRNLVGATNVLRSVEHKQVPKSPVAQRGFTAIQTFDALAWLRNRSDFQIAPFRPGLFARRLERISDEIARGRAAFVAGMAIGHKRSDLARRLDVDEAVLSELADGVPAPGLANHLAQVVSRLDLERSSNTVPA